MMKKRKLIELKPKKPMVLYGRTMDKGISMGQNRTLRNWAVHARMTAPPEQAEDCVG